MKAEKIEPGLLLDGLQALLPELEQALHLSAPEQAREHALHWLFLCLFQGILEDRRLTGEELLQGAPEYPRRRLLEMAGVLEVAQDQAWVSALSDEAATLLCNCFRRDVPDSLIPAGCLRDVPENAGFLADLYQALCVADGQSQIFGRFPREAADFLLSHTLDKAEGERILLDPACGAGDLLVAVLRRMVNAEKGGAVVDRVRDCLGRIHAVDANPIAIRISRFRLLIAALELMGDSDWRDVSAFDCKLACGDVLLQGGRHQRPGHGLQADLVEGPKESEPDPLLREVLARTYPLVLCRLPDTPVTDEHLLECYRQRFGSCQGRFSLIVPYIERCFDLCREEGQLGLLGNGAFMRQRQGRGLVEGLLAQRDLTHLVDVGSALAYAGETPAMILLARNRPPQADSIRTLLRFGSPVKERSQRLWQTMQELVEQPGGRQLGMRSDDQARVLFSKHPWNLNGPAAAELTRYLQQHCPQRLQDRGADIGVTGVSGEERIFRLPARAVAGLGAHAQRLIGAEQILDWALLPGDAVLVPAAGVHTEPGSDPPEPLLKHLWPYRAPLQARSELAELSRRHGLQWYQHLRLHPERRRTPLGIAAALSASHSQFALLSDAYCSGSSVLIRLRADADEREYRFLVGLLNSSVGCFWLKQHARPKGAGSPQLPYWLRKQEYPLSALRQFPLPATADEAVQECVRRLHDLGQRLMTLEPGSVLARWSVERPLGDVLEEAEGQQNALLSRMRTWQEELDWRVYRLFGLVGDDLADHQAPPGLRPGQRVFEYCEGESGDEATTIQPPRSWPPDYRRLCLRRQAVMQKQSWIGVLERPEYKRPWVRPTWAERRQAALKDWLLARLEHHCRSFDLIGSQQLAVIAEEDPALVQVAELYAAQEPGQLRELVETLIAEAQVPAMAACRYKPAGVEKFRRWQKIWARQYRQEQADVGDKRPDELPSDLPAYNAIDYRRPEFWRHRGRWDVPKERFFGLPDCHADDDAGLLIGWAGLDHAQRFDALKALYLQRRGEGGWRAEQLLPVLVALDELVPWLLYFHRREERAFLDQQLQQLGLDGDSLSQWNTAGIQAVGE